MLESAHAPPHVLRRACHLLLLVCQVNHQGLYHRVGLPPSHFSRPDTSHLLSASRSLPPLCAHLYCKQYTSTLKLVTTLYSHDMLLHVLLKPCGALGKPISPSFAETYLALGTPTEVASNYGQAYSQEQNNG